MAAPAIAPMLTWHHGWIVNHIANGIAINFASDILETGEANIRSSFNFAMTKPVSILTVSIITGILTVTGLIALIVPDMILTIMFSLVVPTLIIGDIRALESLSSRILLSHRWLKTSVLFFILYVLVGIAADWRHLSAAPRPSQLHCNKHIDGVHRTNHTNGVTPLFLFNDRENDASITFTFTELTMRSHTLNNDESDLPILSH